jgi:hypothetical protein
MITLECGRQIKVSCPGCGPFFVANQMAHMRFGGCMYDYDEDEEGMVPLVYPVDGSTS